VKQAKRSQQPVAGRGDHEVINFHGRLIPVLGVVGGTREQSEETARNIERFLGTATAALCLVCKRRAPGQPDTFESRFELDYNSLCDECRAARKMVHTSIDDARQAIKTCRNVDVLYQARLMERGSKSPRVSILSMLNRRLTKLIGVYHAEGGARA
jgi:hypothetical protein